MRIVQQGSGSPLVLIPGIQGKWQYLRPAIDALSTEFRVITFSLCGEPDAEFAFDAARGFESYVDQVRVALDDAHVGRAIVCGISFGGLVALRFAATHPARTAALVLASSPGPDWRLARRHEVYARHPWLFAPLFAVESPRRLAPELAVAFPSRAARLRFGLGQLRALASAPLSLARMAARAQQMASVDVAADCAMVGAPTLVVTGEPGLDLIVRTDTTCAMARLIKGARHVMLPRTGHLGSITRPALFASAVRGLVSGLEDGRHGRIGHNDAA